MSQEEWVTNFRMARSDTPNLAEMMRPFAKEQSTKVQNDVITLEKRIAITLHYVKDQGSLRVTTNLIGIAKCIASVVVHNLWYIGQKYSS